MSKPGTTREHRRHIPIGVKLHACLLLLGYTDEEITGGAIQWDHFPALGLRLVDEATGELVPHPNDPRAIRPMRKDDHKVKTCGLPATTAGSDIHGIAKAKRLTNEQEEFRARLLRKQPGEKRKPKGTIRSRGFDKSKRRFG